MRIILDYRTRVCYNMCGATLRGRRLVLLRKSISLRLHRNPLRKSHEEDCAYAYNGTLYSHNQLMYYLLCSWLYRWF